MAHPLITLGPGGDYTSRYFVKGNALAKQSSLRQIGNTLGQEPDTETAGSFAGYGHSGGRRRKASQDPRDSYSDNPQMTIDGDAFEHSLQMEQPAEQVIYVRDAGMVAGITEATMIEAGKLAAAAVARRIVMSAQTAAAAAEAWLAAQQRTLIAIPLFSPAQFQQAQQNQQTQQAARQRIRSVDRNPIAEADSTCRPLPLSLPLIPSTELSRQATPIAYRAASNVWTRLPANNLSLIKATKAIVPPSTGGAMSEDWHREEDETIEPVHVTEEAEHQHESDTQTTAHSHPYSRPASDAGLLADHAGTGRRTQRQQGHGLRARRSAHQKGSALARPQQGTLFNS